MLITIPISSDACVLHRRLIQQTSLFEQSDVRANNNASDEFSLRKL